MKIHRVGCTPPIKIPKRRPPPTALMRRDGGKATTTKVNGPDRGIEARKGGTHREATTHEVARFRGRGTDMNRHLPEITEMTIVGKRGVPASNKGRTPTIRPQEAIGEACLGDVVTRRSTRALQAHPAAQAQPGRKRLASTCLSKSSSDSST